MKYKIQIFTILFTIFFVFNFTAAEETIKLAGYTFPPYNYKDSNGKFTGVDIEITEAVFKRMGYVIEWIDLPFNRALLGVKSGDYAGIAPCVASAERKKFTNFSSYPTAALDRVFFNLKNRKLSWKTYEDLKGLTVGACDYSYPQHFWDAGKNQIFKIDVVKTTQPDLVNFKKLVSKRIDLLIVDRAVGVFIIKQNAPQFDNTEIAPEVSIDRVPVPFSFGLSKKYWNGKGKKGEEILNAYTKELDAFVKEGKRNKIFAKYGIVYKLDKNNHIILE